MPNYTYKCTIEFCLRYHISYDFKVKMADLDEFRTHCKGCGGEMTRVIVSPANVQYKGDGFATTDNPNRK